MREGFSRRRRHAGASRSVLLIGSLALVAILGSAVLVERGTDAALRTLARIDAIHGIEGHLQEAERANDQGQALLLEALRATDRGPLLAAAVAVSDKLNVAMSRYRAESFGLPGERALADAFAADLEIVHGASTAAIVAGPDALDEGGVLSDQQTAHAVVQDDLAELQHLYAVEAGARADDLAKIVRWSRVADLVWTAAQVAVLAVLGGVGVRNARRRARERAEWSKRATRSDFEVDLQRALDFALDQPAAFVAAARAIEDLEGAHVATSVVTADDRSGTVVAARNEPACRVDEIADCPALRSGTTFVTADSTGFASCPVLAAAAPRGAAVCVPVVVAGRAAGLVQVVAPYGDVADQDGAELVARHLGERATLLEALATLEVEASHDPLTGLLNRRSLDLELRRLLEPDRPFAVAFGDLDHFKALNDEHGHDAGDRALEAFTRLLLEHVRPGDLACRWGGEEFVVVLPDCDAARAVEVMERVRTSLALAGIAGSDAPVRVSFGVADSADGGAFDDVVARADTALLAAKEAGRNRVVRYEPSLG